MSDKIFKTYREQIELLKLRGIDFSSKKEIELAEKILKKVGYYNLINGYKDLFINKNVPEDSNEQFKPATTLNEIYSLYLFDRHLRNIFFRYILDVEEHIKNLIAYHFSSEYGHDNYLIYSNFDSARNDSWRNITGLISSIQNQISSKTSDPSIAHYLVTYGYIPLWVLNNILSFGTVSKFYSLMKQKDQQNISKEFGITEDLMTSIMFYLSKVRNFCAHGNRLYCFRNSSPLAATTVHNNMGIEKNDNGQYIRGRIDLFAAVICLKYLLGKKEFGFFIYELNRAIDKLESKLFVIKIDDVFRLMGFPVNWKRITKI